MIALHKSPRYKEFLDQRNLALESILQKYLNRVDRVVAGLEEFSKEIAAYAYQNLEIFKQPQDAIEYLDKRLQLAFKYAGDRLTELALNLNTSTYTLAYAGEAEAISRALGEPKDVQLTKEKIADRINGEAPAGGSLPDRMQYYLSKLRRKVLTAVELGFINNETFPKILTRIESAFPRQHRIKRPTRVLKPKVEQRAKFTEATPPNKPIDESALGGFIDQETWDNLIQDFLKEEIDPRGPEDILVLQVQGKRVERYLWEVEQEITQSFVEQVRKGEIDAANENGIDDLVWIAILDSDTDECCIWRDGKTSKEIAKLLKTSKSSDPCKATVTPAHFGCRCTMSPLTPDLPDKPPKSLGDFESWLK